MHRRKHLIAELERLEPSRKARAIHRQRDTRSLARAVAQMQNAEREVERMGHIVATRVDLPKVAPKDD